MKRYVLIIPGKLDNPVSWKCERAAMLTDIKTILIFTKGIHTCKK